MSAFSESRRLSGCENSSELYLQSPRFGAFFCHSDHLICSKREHPKKSAKTEYKESTEASTETGMETTETVKDAGTKPSPETGAEMGAKTDVQKESTNR